MVMISAYQRGETADPMHRAAARHTGPRAVAYPAVPALQKKNPDEGKLHKKSVGPFAKSQDAVVRRKSVVQMKSMAGMPFMQKREGPSARELDHTGMPGYLKAGIENLSGFSTDDRKVHCNAFQSAQLNALAYAQETDNHRGSGQEGRPPREAPQVVQQKQGRANPTQQTNVAAITDDKEFERRTHLMGRDALSAVRGIVKDLSVHQTVQKGTGPALVHPIGQNKIIQKVSVEPITHANRYSDTVNTHLTSPVIQAVNVEVARQPQQGSAVSNGLLDVVIRTMKEIVEEAEKAEGKANSGEEHKRLTEILGNQKLTEELPSSSSATFGLGGSNYFGTPFTTTQGPKSFGDAVSAIPETGVSEHLGSRKTGLHDEIFHISRYPGLQALASTQGHCFFCYGTIHGRGYEHGELRETDPWPQDWQHDFQGFKLKKTSASMNAIEHAFDPVIKITSDEHGVRYYFVSKA